MQTAAGNLEEFMKSERDGVYYIGHASALARVGGKLLMFDPVWNHEPYGKEWTFFPAQINCDSILEKVDAIFISHIHDDHICASILTAAKCPVFIMGGREHLANRLRSYGCNVFECSRMDWITDASDKVDFMFVPHAFNTIDSSVFVRSKETGWVLYHGSDNFLDEDLCDLVKAKVEYVDVALVPYAFVHWYPHNMGRCMTEQAKAWESNRLNEKSARQAEMFANIFDPGISIPFGANLFYKAPLSNPLNNCLLTPYELDEFQFTPEFTTGSSLFIESMPAKSGGFHHGFRYYPLGHETEEQYVEELHKFLSQYEEPKQREYRELSHDEINDHAEGFAWAVNNDEFGQPTPVKNHIMVINGMEIDLETFKFSKFDQGREKIPGKEYTFFYLEKEVMNKWNIGQVTFEQCIGTRKFVCERYPNRYNLAVFEFMNKYL